MTLHQNLSGSSLALVHLWHLLSSIFLGVGLLILERLQQHFWRIPSWSPSPRPKGEQSSRVSQSTKSLWTKKWILSVGFWAKEMVRSRARHQGKGRWDYAEQSTDPYDIGKKSWGGLDHFTGDCIECDGISRQHWSPVKSVEEILISLQRYRQTRNLTRKCMSSEWVINKSVHANNGPTIWRIQRT